MVRSSSQARVPARVLVGGLLGVLVRPDLWPTALRLAAQVTPRGWWRAPGRLPRPDAQYLAFRMSTAYGDTGAPRTAELVEYLEWVRAHRRARRSSD